MGTVRPLGIVYGNGIGDQQADGHWTCVSLCLIEAITETSTCPAAGERPAPPSLRWCVRTRSTFLSERLPRSAEDERLGYAAGMSRLLAPEFPRWYQKPSTWESGPNSAYFKALMTALTDEPVRLRAAFAQATNPLSATRQPKKVAKALERLELFVVHDTHWSPSCAYADYVLPAVHAVRVLAAVRRQELPRGHVRGRSTRRSPTRRGSRALIGTSTCVWPWPWATGPTSGTATWTRACASSLRDRA